MVKFLWSVGQESIQWAVSSGQIWPGIPPTRARHELVTSDGFPWFRGHIAPVNAATRFAAGRGGGGSGPEISGHSAGAEICWREGCGPEARPGEAAACVASAECQVRPLGHDLQVKFEVLRLLEPERSSAGSGGP